MSKETTDRHDYLRGDDEDLELDWQGLGSSVFEPAEAAGRLREAVLARTSQVVRRRGRVRRFGSAIVILLVFASGFTVGSTTRDDTSYELDEHVSGDVTALAIDPETQELQAELAGSSRQAALYRQAGNLYAESGVEGFERAILCFGQSLGPESAGARFEPHRDDHWLMLALARAREMEGDL